MNISADDVRVACPLFQVDCGGSIPTSALQLFFQECSVDRAQELNRHIHSVLPETNRFNISGGIYFIAEHEGIAYATAIWTRPVARMLDQKRLLELRRFAITDDAPKNTASRMLGWMVRYIKKDKPHIERLISYQDMGHHAGTIYKASGWNKDIVSPGGEWSVPSRYRKNVQSSNQKARWYLDLKTKETP